MLVIIISAALMVPSFLGMLATRSQYDLLSYLPQHLDTVRGQDILLEDFGKGAFSMLVTEGLTLSQQRDLENELKAIPHVDSVIGYASITNATLPVEILPTEYRELFQKDGRMLSAIFFDSGSSTMETMEAILKVREAVGENGYVSGLSAGVTDTKHMVEEQEYLYVGIAVALCAIVLMITMDSALLPIIFLACIGVSVLWNMGSNIMLGSISYITKSVAAVLQLAVTLDYSIFLWHSYQEKREIIADRDEAMAEAIRATFTSILGSSLTTVAGFVAICFMSFTLGKDLGIVMCKGVILGVLATVTLLPCMIRALDGILEKTHHTPLLPDVHFIGRFVARHAGVLFIVLLLLFFPAFYGYSNVNIYYDMSHLMPEDLPSVQADLRLQESFHMSTSHLALVDAYVSQKDVLSMTREMQQVDGVTSVFSLDTILGTIVPETILPRELITQLKGERYQLMLINSSFTISTDEINEQIERLNTILKKYDPQGMLIGEGPCTKDLIACTAHDFTVVSLISILAIFLIIMLVQRSLSLPVLLVAIIELAIAANLCIPYYSGEALPFIGPILVSTIQLGATVDYAILMTTRFKKNRLEGMKARDAIEDAVSSAARSVLVSGLGFFAATYGVGLLSNMSMISSMCRLIARGALLSVAVVLLLLPAVLLLSDRLISHTTLGMKTVRAAERKVRS